MRLKSIQLKPIHLTEEEAIEKAEIIDATEEEIKEYQHKVKEIVENSDGLSTPQVAEKMDNLRQELFGNVTQFLLRVSQTVHGSWRT